MPNTAPPAGPPIQIVLTTAASPDEANRLARTLVEERDDALDRLRVPVVGVLGAHVRDAAADAPTRFVLGAERSRRPRVDLHAVEVVDAASAERGLPLGVLLHPDDGHDRLAEEQRGAHARGHGPRAHLALGDRDDDVELANAVGDL